MQQTLTPLLRIALHAKQDPVRAQRAEEHTQITRRMEREIRKVKASVIAAGLLSEKIEARAKQKRLEEALRQHKLNYFAFLDQAVTA